MSSKLDRKRLHSATSPQREHSNNNKPPSPHKSHRHFDTTATDLHSASPTRMPDKRHRSGAISPTTTTTSTAGAADVATRSFSPNNGPSTSGSYSRLQHSNVPTASASVSPTIAKSHQIPTPNSQRLTKSIMEQIPYLEHDPLKALEMLKKMVQDSGLETLYTSVNENTSRARDFSDRIAVLKKDVNHILNFMLSGKPSEAEKMDKYKQMKTIWSKIHGLNEAKVQLTQDAYDMVDRVIRRLDKELTEINNEIGVEKNVVSSGSGGGGSGRPEKGPSKKNTHYQPYTGAMGASFEGQNRPRARGTNFDMPVDPNEPTYCDCRQISFGEMIACDNVSCPIEWFHFSCVNLSSKPKGKWFCRRCVAAGQNKLGKKKKPRPGLIEKLASASDKSEVDHILSTADESE